MLVTSFFSFSRNVFYSNKDINHHFSNSHFVVCICFWGPAVKCLTRNPGVLGLSRTGSSEFVGMSLGKTLQSPSLVLVKPRKDMNNVSCHCDMTEILLKAA